jgi:nitroimidazol reductase NimA-like FMN-containing flavoprotein (pyridoxamine 5'-phosphate oxidase superfamily)
MEGEETIDRFGATIMPSEECWQLLRSVEVGRLAVAIGNRPDIFPVNFVVDHGAVIFRTAGGTKFAAGVLGECVAFEVDGYDPDVREAWSVVLRGRAVELEGADNASGAGTPPLVPWHAASKPRVVRIEPDDISGRRFRVQHLAGQDPEATSSGPSARAGGADHFVRSRHP